SDRLFWFGGAGWERNIFAGIDNRYSAGGGLGNIWRSEDRVKFRTDYALTYTKQEDVVKDPNFDDTFLGARFSWAFQHAFGSSTTYGNDFIINENLHDTTDLRGDMTNWVSVTMTSKLALKVSLQWLYDNEPSDVAASDPSGLLPPGQVVLVELEKFDSIFTSSLVVKF